MPGVGKTSIGKSLSTLLSINHIDTDQQIETKESESINDIIQKRGENTFRELEKRELKIAIQSNPSSIISTGGGTILNDENRILIKERGYGIHLKSTIKEIAGRIDTKHRPLLYNTNKIEKLEQIWLKREKLYNNTSKVELNINGLSIAEATQKLWNEVQNACN